MRHIPNILTVLRAALSVPLLFLAPFSLGFFCVYLLCGVTDAADGFLARRLHAETRLGAALDSAADLLFFSITIVIFWPHLPCTAAAYCALGTILLLKSATLCIGFLKYRRLPFLHTYASKAAGLFLFLFPFLCVLIRVRAAFALVAAVAAYAALEEVVITLKCPDFVPDRKGLFSKQ